MRKLTYHFLLGTFVISLLMLLFGVVCWGMPMMHPWFSQHLLIRVAIPVLVIAAILRELILTARLVSRFTSSSDEALQNRVRDRAHSVGIAPEAIRLIDHPLSIAFCIGLLKPTITISTGLVERLSPKQLKAVLLHEYYHVLRHDPLRTLIVDVIRTALFFLPVIHEWHRMVKAQMEMQADQYAVQRVGKAALAGALHRLLSEENHPKQLSGAAAGLSINALRVANLLGDTSFSYQLKQRSLIISTLILWMLCIFMI